MGFRNKITTKLGAQHKQNSIAWKSKNIWLKRRKHLIPTKRMEESTKAKELEARDQYSAESVPQEIPCYLGCTVILPCQGKSQHTGS